MNPFIKRMTASAAGVFFATSSICSIGAQATQTGANDNEFLNSTFAKATQVAGLVTKSEPSDQTRSSYGDFLPCHVGDKLPESTLVQTGKSSSAEVRWVNNGKDVGVTRLWPLSLATITSKSRLVFLQKGIVIHQRKNDSTDHVIETKLLQARVHGTTVRVWSDENSDKILVTETDSKKGVEVYNKINKSRIMLQPGIVLEVRNVLLKSSTTPITPSMCLKPDKGELIFQDSKTQTFAYTANAKSVFEDPLISGGAAMPAIDSIDLIKRDMKSVPSSDNVLGNVVEAAFNIGRADKLISHNISISKVPTTRYYIGPNVGSNHDIALPELPFNDFQPAGRIENPIIAAGSSSQSPTAMNHPTMAVRPLFLPDAINGESERAATADPVQRDLISSGRVLEYNEADIPGTQENTGKTN